MSKPSLTHAKSNCLWSSQLGFILATTGAAVGLGNIWKFPYMAGAHGGSAFVLIYLLALAAIGIPLMMGEMVLGRLGQHNPVATLSNLAKQYKVSRKWSYLGWWGSITLLLVLSFYSVIAGWSLYYLALVLKGGLNGLSDQAVHQVWLDFQSSPKHLWLYHTLFIIMTLGIVSKGVQAGIEKSSRIMMPALFAILIVLVGFGASKPGFVQAWCFLFDFKMQAITPEIAIYALGHAFFTLAIGAGCILVYGAYLPKSIPMTKTIFIITLLDVLVAVLSGMAIFPIVFSHDLPPQGGPALMFEALPIAFTTMGGGQWFGALFFSLLFFAALTSSISMAEPMVFLLTERFGMKRTKSSWIVGLLTWILGALCALSFNTWQNVTVLGHTLFDAITDLTTNIMLPLGGLGFALFVGWCLPKSPLQKALNITNRRAFKLWHGLVRWLCPLGILIICIQGWIG